MRRGTNARAYASLGLHAPPSTSSGETPWSLNYKTKGSGFDSHHPLDAHQTRILFDDILAGWDTLAQEHGGIFTGSSPLIIFTRHGQDHLIPTDTLDPAQQLADLWRGLIVPSNLETMSFAIASNIRSVYTTGGLNQSRR